MHYYDDGSMAKVGTIAQAQQQRRGEPFAWANALDAGRLLLRRKPPTNHPPPPPIYLHPCVHP